MLTGLFPVLYEINQAGHHLPVLINDVLELPKIESGKMVAFTRDVVVEWIDQVADAARPNTLSNAAKFTSEGTVAVGASAATESHGAGRDDQKPAPSPAPRSAGENIS